MERLSRGLQVPERPRKGVVREVDERLQGREPPPMPVLLQPEPLDLPVALRVVRRGDPVADPSVRQELRELALHPRLALADVDEEGRPAIGEDLPHREVPAPRHLERLLDGGDGVPGEGPVELPAHQDHPTGIVQPQDAVGVGLAGPVEVPVQQRARVRPLVSAVLPFPLLARVGAGEPLEASERGHRAMGDLVALALGARHG